MRGVGGLHHFNHLAPRRVGVRPDGQGGLRIGPDASASFCCRLSSVTGSVFKYIGPSFGIVTISAFSVAPGLGCLGRAAPAGPPAVA